GGLHAVSRLRRRCGPDLPDTRPALQAARSLVGEYPAIPGIAYGVQGRPAGRDVIGLVQDPASPGVAEVVRDHDLRTVLADCRSDGAAQLDPVLEDAVRQAEELHRADPDDSGRLDLLRLT